MPAGTGVCVVNSVDDRTTSSASSNDNDGAGDQLANSLERKESGVPFVHVVDLGLRRARSGGRTRALP